MIDQKIFTLKDVDENMQEVNVRLFDGDKPSPLSGISLTTSDSNLHQHGLCMYLCSITLMPSCS